MYFNLVVATISFNQSMYSVNENEGSIQPVLVLSNPSSTDVTVQVTDEEGTASGKQITMININAVTTKYNLIGDDYTSGPYDVVILAGQMQVQFSVSIMDNVIVESDENFALIINSTSLPNKINISPNRTNITILDDDG